MLRKLPPSVAIVLTLLVATATPASAATWTSSGRQDFVAGSEVKSGGGVQTGQKPESKLFYTPDGRWWAVLGESTAARRGVFLYELVNHAWQARTRIHDDPWMKADTLFTATGAGGELLVALRDSKSLTGNPRRSVLVRLTYSGSAWGNVSSETTITPKSIETLTIARDSASRIWAAWEAGRNIQVSALAPGATAFPLPTTISNSRVNGDDIASITSLASGRIGVLWSDQVARKFFFATRPDGGALTKAAWTIETAYGGGVGGCPSATATLCADDHVNVKVVGDELWAAVKTSNDDSGNALASDPLIVLLHRSSSGVWDATKVSSVSLDHTRPIVVVSPSDGRVYVFSSKLSGGTYYWQSSLAAPSFSSSPTGAWTVNGSRRIGDATSTKQEMKPAVGLVVETSYATTYWHNEILPAG